MKIRCLKCNDIIESMSLHDCRDCKCGACYIDGGSQYTRIGGNPKFINLVYEDETEKNLEENNSNTVLKSDSKVEK